MENNHQITLTEWAETKKELERAILDVKQGFVRTGYYLRKIRDGKLYEQDGYDSLAKWAGDKYNMNGPTVSRLIAINEQFSEDGFSKILDKRYEGFSFGMLVEMKDLSPEGREMVTPETPREEVRELRRYEKEAATAEPENHENAAKEPETTAKTFENAAEETPFEKIFRAFLDGQYSTAGQVREFETALESSSVYARVKDIICPSGQRMWRSEAKLIIFGLSEIKIKRSFFSVQEKTDWEEFLQVLRKWLPEKRAEIEEAEAEAAERERRNREEQEREKAAIAREREELEERNRKNAAEYRTEAAEPAEPENEEPEPDQLPASDPGPDEPEGDVRGDNEDVCGSESESDEVEVIPPEKTEIIENLKRTGRPAADLDVDPEIMPEPEAPNNEVGDLMEKVDKAYKTLGVAIDKEHWKKAATEARKILNYVEKLEDFQK